MRRFLAACAVVALAAATVAAQPGPPQPPPPPGQGPYAQPPPGPYAPPPGQGPYAPGPYGSPGPGVPPPYAYQPQPQPPTPEEAELMASGYIGPGAQFGGGVVAIWVGFGLGQALQGRWHDTGWIFTLGESAAIVGIIGGAVNGFDCGNNNNQSCPNNNGSVTLLVASALAFGGLRLWEIVDAFAGPSSHNERVHELRRRYGYRDYARVTPSLSPSMSHDGTMTTGLTLRF